MERDLDELTDKYLGLINKYSDLIDKYAGLADSFADAKLEIYYLKSNFSDNPNDVQS